MAEEESDQIIHDLEQKYLTLQGEHDAVCRERDSLRGFLFRFCFVLSIIHCLFLEKIVGSDSLNGVLKERNDILHREISLKEVELKQVDNFEGEIDHFSFLF